jgi:hypothetical protein
MRPDDGVDLRLRAALPLYGGNPAPRPAAVGELRRSAGV